MRYYTFSEYLKKRFGCRVSKISVDAGFSCPNRDGRIGKDGCIYCDNRGFSFNSRVAPRPLESQIEEGIYFASMRFKTEKFIVYFQAYTNTYAPLETLKTRYDIVKKYKNIVSIAIGTRPDSIDEDTLDLIKTYAKDYEVWLELGLQSIHNKTLEFINRGHTYEDFLNAVKMVRRKVNIKICAHVIIGLPHETEADIMETAKTLGKLKLDAIKIHPLHVIRGTKLAEMYDKGSYTSLEFDDYIRLVTGFLEYMWPRTIIQRLAADCPREFLVAPLWISEKQKVLAKIEDLLSQKDTFQGRLFRLA